MPVWVAVGGWVEVCQILLNCESASSLEVGNLRSGDLLGRVAVGEDSKVDGKVGRPDGLNLTVAAGALEPELDSSDRSGPRGIPMESENLLPLPRPSTVFRTVERELSIFCKFTFPSNKHVLFFFSKLKIHL